MYLGECESILSVDAFEISVEGDTVRAVVQGK